MNERIIRLRKDSARISRRTFFNSAGAAGAGLVAACALSNSAHAGNDKDKDKDKDEEKEKEVGPLSLCELPNPIPHTAPTPFGPILDNFFPGPVEGTLAATEWQCPH